MPEEENFEIKDLRDLEIKSVDFSSELCALEAGDIYVDIESSLQSSQIKFYYNGEVVSSDNVFQLETKKYKVYIAEPTEIFTLRIANSSGCFSDEFLVDSTFKLSGIDFTSNSYEQSGSYRVNDPIVFRTNYDFLTIPDAYSYVTWDFGDNSFRLFTFAENQNADINNEYINQVFHTYSVDGIYEITYRLHNVFGCFIEEKFQIRIGTGYEIIIPTGFTPNDDNINDIFRPVFSGFVDVYMAVYDQQGNMVYTMQDDVENLSSEWGWDGRRNGKGEPVSGPYRYIINATSLDGEFVTRVGEVFLIN